MGLSFLAVAQSTKRVDFTLRRRTRPPELELVRSPIPGPILMCSFVYPVYIRFLLYPEPGIIHRFSYPEPGIIHTFSYPEPGIIHTFLHPVPCTQTMTAVSGSSLTVDSSPCVRPELPPRPLPPTCTDRPSTKRLNEASPFSPKMSVDR